MSSIILVTLNVNPSVSAIINRRQDYTALDPHEIQIGILKRLRGTRIGCRDSEYGMRYSDDPPYEILQTRDISLVTNPTNAADLPMTIEKHGE